MTDTIADPSEAPVVPELHPVFATQIECLMRKDFDGIMDTLHPEIVSMQFNGPLYGREAARDHIREYETRDIQFVSIEEYAHCDDMIMTRTTLRVNGEDVVAFGAYVIRDGMIWRQFGCDEGGSRDWDA
jgi:hypothetical protein